MAPFVKAARQNVLARAVGTTGQRPPVSAAGVSMHYDPAKLLEEEAKAAAAAARAAAEREAAQPSWVAPSIGEPSPLRTEPAAAGDEHGPSLSELGAKVGGAAATAWAKTRAAVEGLDEAGEQAAQKAAKAGERLGAEATKAGEKVGALLHAWSPDPDQGGDLPARHAFTTRGFPEETLVGGKEGSKPFISVPVDYVEEEFDRDITAGPGKMEAEGPKASTADRAPSARPSGGGTASGGKPRMM